MACDPRTNGLEFTEEQTTIAAQVFVWTMNVQKHWMGTHGAHGVMGRTKHKKTCQDMVGYQTSMV